MTVPYAFGSATSAIPLSQLDANFNTPITLGNTAIQLGNTVTTLNNMTLANVTITSGNVTITSGNVTVTNANVTSALTLSGLTASTALALDASKNVVSVTNTGTGNNVLAGSPTLSGTVSAAAVTMSSDLTLSGGTANGVGYLNASKVLTTGSALTFDGTILGNALTANATYSEMLRLRNNGVGDGTGAKLSFNFSGTERGYVGTTYSSGWITDLNGTDATRFLLNSSEQMRLTSTGLGIGTSSPAYKLDVGLGSPSSSTLGMRLITGNIGNLVVGLSQNSTNLGTASTSADIYTTAALDLRFGTNGVERLRLDASGNLGLGVTPSAWGSGIKSLDVNGSSFASSTATLDIANNAYYNGAGWIYKNTATAAKYTQSGGIHYWYNAPSGTAGNTITFTQAMTLDASGNWLLGTTTNPDSRRMRVYGISEFDGSGVGLTIYKSSGTKIGSAGQGDYVVSGGPSDGFGIQSQTALVFGSGGTTERARIDSSGNLLVGTTTTNRGTSGFDVASDGSFHSSTDSSVNSIIRRLVSNGDGIQFVATSGSIVGAVTINATTTTYNTSSDYRLKEDIAPMTGALAKVAALKPVTYKWKSDGSDGEGFIAHELAEVCPHAVTGEKDAVDEDGKPKYQGIDTSFLVATLTAAIQELKAEVDSLKSQLKGA